MSAVPSTKSVSRRNSGLTNGFRESADPFLPDVEERSSEGLLESLTSLWLIGSERLNATGGENRAALRFVLAQGTFLTT